MFLYRDREASRVWTGSRVLGSGCEVRAVQTRGRGQNETGFKKVGGRGHERTSASFMKAQPKHIRPVFTWSRTEPATAVL